MDTLVLEHVTKVFEDGTRALEDISLSVAPGELVSLVGPSGCGKTTILRLAAGLEQPTSGRVNTHTPSGQAASISYVFQDPTLLEWRSALRNVELLGELGPAGARIDKGERRRRALDALEAVGLADARAKFPRQLSGGMRMRVSLARAIVLDPDLALFDEPFAAVDEITRLALQTLLQDLFAQRTFAGLFITHSVSEAVYLSNRVIVMGRGRIAAEIAIEHEHPRDPQWRYSTEFAELSGQVSRLLEEAS